MLGAVPQGIQPPGRACLSVHPAADGRFCGTSQAWSQGPTRESSKAARSRRACRDTQLGAARSEVGATQQLAPSLGGMAAGMLPDTECCLKQSRVHTLVQVYVTHHSPGTSLSCRSEFPPFTTTSQLRPKHVFTRMQPRPCDQSPDHGQVKRFQAGIRVARKSSPLALAGPRRLETTVSAAPSVRSPAAAHPVSAAALWDHTCTHTHAPTPGGSRTDLSSPSWLA